MHAAARAAEEGIFSVELGERHALFVLPKRNVEYRLTVRPMKPA
jgi:hypothetical protein